MSAAVLAADSFCEVSMKMVHFLVVVGLLAAPLATMAADGPSTPDQDPLLLRFVERAITHCPDSTFQLTSVERELTPSGSYRIVEFDRACSSDLLSGQKGVVIDDVTDLAWFGNAAKLPLQETGMGGDALKNFVNEFLPDALRSALRMKASLDWTDPPYRNGALLPFWLVVDTGYGEYRMAAAVTSDGAYFVLGPVYPMDSDPVELRRQMMSESAAVIWDHMESDQASVEIVEFSDLECPACRRRSGQPFAHGIRGCRS